MPTYKINGKDYAVTIGAIQGTTATVNVNGVDYSVELPDSSTSLAAAAPITAGPAPKAASAASNPTATSAGAGSVTAPLPGTVLSINCKIGDVVKASDTIIILEAMKMENAINAGRDGKITDIRVKQGDSVLEGDVLVTIG